MTDSGTPDIRDVADFHLRWSEFRPLAEAALRSANLPDDQRQVLSWLVLLADRVGESDVAPRKPPARGIDEMGNH